MVQLDRDSRCTRVVSFLLVLLCLSLRTRHIVAEVFQGSPPGWSCTLWFSDNLLLPDVQALLEIHLLFVPVQTSLSIFSSSLILSHEEVYTILDLNAFERRLAKTLWFLLELHLLLLSENQFRCHSLCHGL